MFADKARITVDRVVVKAPSKRTSAVLTAAIAVARTKIAVLVATLGDGTRIVRKYDLQGRGALYVERAGIITGPYAAVIYNDQKVLVTTEVTTVDTGKKKPR